LPLLTADQLLAMPVGKLAALILPTWAAGDATPRRWRDGEWVALRLAAHLTGQPEPTLLYKPLTDPLVRAVAEAIQLLEWTGLLLRTYSTIWGTLLHLTRRGERALSGLHDHGGSPSHGPVNPP
jgi:hypothetical protein